MAAIVAVSIPAALLVLCGRRGSPTVAVSNPAISVILGALLLQERLTRPSWHVLVAWLALLAAFYGAYLITAANREREVPEGPQAGAAEPGSPMAGPANHETAKQANG